MRYVCSAAAIVFAVSTFASPAAFGALNVSITNYQAVSDQRASLTRWYVTFKADLVNAGPALPGITATIAVRSTNVQVVPGQGTLHFSPVPANGRVTSADTFTLLVDRSVAFDWSQVEWSFMNPVANAGANQTAPVTATVRLDGSGCSNPTGTGTLSYNWAFQSLPPGSRALLTGATTPSPSFVVDTPGAYQIRLTVSNGTGTDSATVTVSTVNSPPVAVAGPNQTVAFGATVSLNGSRSSDIDGDALTYSWTFISIPPQSSAVLFGAQTVSPTFIADARGTYKVQLTVKDGNVESQPSVVTISTANSAPVANAGDNQTVTAGMFVQLNGAASTDVDGDALTYRWSFNSLPTGSAAALSNPAVVNPTFTADKTGIYIVQLIVNDGKIDSAASTVTITTNAVQAPTAIPGPDVTVHAGALVQLNGSGADPQHFPLTYSWSLPTRPAGSTASLSATNVANPSFYADLPGIYGAQLVVSNGTLSSPPTTVTITTTNTPPVADPGPSQSAYIGDTVYLDGSRSSDADNDTIVTYSWTFTSKPEGSSAVLAGANSKTPTFIADLPGPYVVQLIVADSFASSQARTVTINVGARTMAVTPSPLALYTAPGSLTITLSPTPTVAVPVTLTAARQGVATFSPNPVTVPANSSGVNVAVAPLSAGTTNVTVSAAGYYSSVATVTVSPSIAISLSASTVRLANTVTGTITLNADAPAGGTVVALSSAPSPDGVVSLDPATVSIAAGSRTGTFTITGSQLGIAAINAAAPGFTAGSRTIEVVMIGSVALPIGATVGSGQSAPLNVQLTAPAPPNGVTVTLASADTGKLTISPSTVFIRGGATSPDTPPQVFGAAGFAGETTVTASATGFYSDRQSIKVMGSITFMDQAVSVGPGGVKSFTLLLSAPAPTGGLLVYLTSSDERVASVPAGGAIIPAGQQSVVSQVSGGATGSADITLSTNPSIPGNQYFSGAGAVLHVTVARQSLSIITTSLPAASAGANYPSTLLSATGGSGLGYFWSIPVGSLPSGLTLSTSGAISGNVATSATTSTFTVQVQDSAGNRDTKSFTITVNPQISIVTDSLPTGTAGRAYGPITLTATGGTGSGYNWSVISGALPSGLALSAGGVLSGTLAASATTSTFTVQVQDSGTSTASKSFTITVNGPISVAALTLPAGMATGVYPSTTLTATGGSGTGYTWSILSGSLPAGLSLSSGGVLSGTVSSAATTSAFTVQVQDSASNTASRQFTIVINPPLVVSGSLPDGVVGTAYPTTTLSASGGSGSGYVWSVSAGSLPAGLTLSLGGVLSGTLSASATTSIFTVQVKDSDNNIVTKQFTITINSTLSITTATLPTGTAGASYPSTTLSASGGSGSGYVWSLATGSLPTGLILSTAGVISGSLNASATTTTFTVKVKDSGNNTATKDFTLTVNAALGITTASLPAAMVGASYPSATLAASGGSGTGYSWSISAASLPSGLTLSAAGAISGTPASNAVTSTFTVRVQDSDGGAAAKEFTITVYPALGITTASLPAGMNGGAYPSQLLVATGGSGGGYTWSVSAGTLPSGLSLSNSGVLSGTLSAPAGPYTFTVQVQDGAGNTATRQFTFTVNPTLAVTTPSLPGGNAGAAYPSTTLEATGGAGAPYTWSTVAGSLPAGLSLSAGGVVSGTLQTTAATSTFTVQARDSAANLATKQFTITVGNALAISTSSLPGGVPANAYPSQTLAATGGSGTGYTWSVTVGALPAGLTLSPGGVIFGTLSASAATSTFTIQVEDSAGNKATQQFTITMYSSLTILPATLPAGMVGAPYTPTQFVLAGGTGSGYTTSISAGSLPSGMSIGSGNVLSGTPTTAGASTFTLQVEDGGGNRATKQYTLTVYPALAITTPLLPDGSPGASYPSTNLAASGGTGAGYAWSVVSGVLPDGLSLSAGGTVSGTLSSVAATAVFTVQVQDNGGFKATKEFTVHVTPALRITTSSLPAGIAGSAYPSTTLTASGGTGAGYSWSVSSGTLPSALTLSSGGLLSGTLAASAASANVTIRVQDSGGNSTTQAFTITVSPALSITTPSLPNGVAGSAYPSTTLTASGGTGGGYVWSVSSGALPQGLALSSSGVLSGTLSTAAADSTFTIQVKDSGNNTATQQFTINVGSTLEITTGTLPVGVAGTIYGAVAMSAAGGTGSYTWSVTAGQLPPNLALSAAGVLTGSLTSAATTSTFTIQVKDSANHTALKQFTLTVNPALTIAPITLPTAVAGSTYPSTTFSATGGAGSPYTWSIGSGSLPAGLTLSSAGALSGTVDAAATTSTFTVRVQDSGNTSVTGQFTITVNPAVQITTQALPAGTAGSLYPTTTLAASGGTGSGYSWSVLAGGLPSGLSLNSNGAISGTLSAAATTSSVTILVRDSGGNTARKDFTVVVTLTITTGSLPGGTAGAAYTGATLAASGGSGTGYTWSLASGVLPAGLTLTPGGVISGSLSSSAATSNFSVQVQDSNGATATRQLTIAVSGVLTINTPSLPNGTAGAAYPSTTLSASGGTGSGYTWSVTQGSLPLNLSLSAGGTISGSLLTTATTQIVTIQVKDSGNNAVTRQFTLTVNPVLSVTTAVLPNGIAGVAYSSTTLAAAGGTGTGYTWSLAAGSPALPAGLALSSGGVISGTLSPAATSATFTVQVTDSDNNSATRQLAITVNQPLSITTASALPAGTAGAAYPSTALAAAGGTTTGYVWSLAAGSALPDGLALSATGVISGTLTAAAASATFTIQVKDSDNNTATKQFSITVYQPVTVTTPSPLAVGTVGVPYPNTTLTATGGTGTGYTWSLATGSTLPAGLTLSSGGAISGTPSIAATNAAFTVQVRDSAGNTATKQFAITINGALTITTASPLPSGMAGSAYPGATLAASGGTGGGYTWSLAAGSAALPSGLTLSSGGVLSGTLSAAAASATVTVQVQDSGSNTATKQLAITIYPTLSITTASPLPSAMAGTTYPLTTLAATGGTGSGYTWSLAAGSASLPSGLGLSSGGVISGTLSTAAVSATVTIQVQDNGGNTATRQFTVTVYAPLTITTPALPSGVAGNPYTNTTLAATGGTTTGYTWSLAAGSPALPSGLSLSTGGVISGTLSASASSATVTIQVQDSAANTATRQFTIAVNATLSITTASPLPTGIAGNAYPSTTLAASGGTGTGYTWSLAAGSPPLPSGLSLSSGGVISGTLSASASTATVTVQVKDDANNTATKQFAITINPPLSVTTPTLSDGVVGAVYPSTTMAATGGTASGYVWSVSTGVLPSGLILSSAGALSGTPTAAAAVTFTIQVKDSGNNTATKQFTITIHPAVTITTAAAPDGTVGAVYPSTTLVATGGVGTTYSWSVTGGSLPPGLALSTAGVLSGTPTSAGTSLFTVQAQDSGGNIGSRQFTVIVNPGVSITTASLPNGMVGASYPSTNLAAAGGTGSGYTWSVSSGSVPAGLTLTSAGNLSGTPSAAGTVTFTLQVKDSANNTASRQFTIIVYPALGITTASLPGGTAGSTYPTTTLAAGGGTGSGYTWSVAQGTLPSGLTLSSAGVLSGTLAYSATGSTVTIQVKDNGNFTATKQFPISVTAAALTILTGSTLPNAEVGLAYSTHINVVGGTAPYTWSASGLPAWLGLDTNGFLCGSVGSLCGTPSVQSTVSFSITITDSGSPTHQSVTQTFTLTVAGVGGSGTITVPNATVGVNLQTPVVITLNPPTASTVVLTITSGNAGAVLLGNASENGRSPINVTLSAGTSSVQVYVKALTPSAGPVAITASADAGYVTASGNVTITNSGFVLSGPNGTGNGFTTYQGVTTGLTVYPYRLNSLNAPIENQPIRGGLTVNAPIAVSPSTMGTMSSSVVTLAGGDQSGSALYTASFTNSGTASITISPPLGSSFSTPSSGSTLNVTIQQSGFITPTGVTVGRNLQAPISIGLNGPAAVDTTVTVQSSDPTLLRFSTSPTTVGAGTIQLLIRRGYATTADFYAQGYGSTGAAAYTISAPGYGSVTTSMPLGPSGFVLLTPGGQGSDFNVTLGGPNPTLGIATALFNGTSVVAMQSVAADSSVTATLTSFTPSVGTVSPTSVVIPGGSSTGTATFQALTVGTTSIKASAPGYIESSVTATVGNVALFLNPVISVGNFLAAPGLVNLNTPATADVTITIAVDSASIGRMKLAKNVTDAGSNSISVVVRAGTTNAAFWVFGLASSGTASYTASVSGSSSVSDTVALAPSAVALYMGSPGNPSCFSTSSLACTIALSAGPRTVYAVTYQLTTDGTNTINGSQALAGSVALSVPLSNSSPGTGSAPTSVSIAGGANYAAFTFTPLSVGTTVLSVNNLAGWTTPANAFGFDLTQLGITVQ